MPARGKGQRKLALAASCELAPTSVGPRISSDAELGAWLHAFHLLSGRLAHAPRFTCCSAASSRSRELTVSLSLARVSRSSVTVSQGQGRHGCDCACCSPGDEANARPGDPPRGDGRQHQHRGTAPEGDRGVHRRQYSSPSPTVASLLYLTPLFYRLSSTAPRWTRKGSPRRTRNGSRRRSVQLRPSSAASCWPQRILDHRPGRSC